MGKVNNALKMLAYLRNRGKATRKELAEYLEIGIREITRYKEDLESVGITITEKKGRYGGYILENKDYLLPLELSQNEKAALNEGKNFIIDKGYYFSRDFQSAIEKINSITPDKYNGSSLARMFNKSTRAKVSYEEESKKWLTINECILTKNKIKITYINAMGNESKRIVYPQGVYSYYDSNYLIAYCERSDDIRQFKLIRIKNIELLNEKFQISNFDISEYLKSTIGIFTDKKIEVKLKITYPYAQGFKEVQWVEDEIIEEDKVGEYIIYRGTMEGKPDIISFIMGMGNYCEVLEPTELRIEIIDEYKKALEKYK